MMMKYKNTRFTTSSHSRAPWVLLVIAMSLANVGCATVGKLWKSIISGDQGDQVVSTPRFSETNNLRSAQGDRQYRRMNRSRFEEEAELRADAGSLWVMEGQGAYLFSQNQMRMVGDLLNVRIEGGPKAQLQTKVRVIAKLLDRLESPSRGLASQTAARAPATGDASAADGNGQAKPGEAPGANAGANQPAQDSQTSKSLEGPMNVQTVPTRIVEQLKDGSYRVRGMQPFMIGKREYKVIVTGIVRAEDFDDNGIEAEKLLDPQFDVVSSRKGANL